MLIVGILLLIFASFLHAWYAENTRARRGTQSIGFMTYGIGVMAFAVVIWIVGAVLIWIDTSFLQLVGWVVAYFLLMSVVMIHLLRWAKLVPPVERLDREEFDMPKAPSAEDFAYKLISIFILASKEGDEFVNVNAGQLHRLVGGYPGSDHRMPVCCSVMRNEMRNGDIIIEEPEKGQGASFTVRYSLPRYDSNSEALNRGIEEGKEEARRVLASLRRPESR